MGQRLEVDPGKRDLWIQTRAEVGGEGLFDPPTALALPNDSVDLRFLRKPCGVSLSKAWIRFFKVFIFGSLDLTWRGLV